MDGREDGEGKWWPARIGDRLRLGGRSGVDGWLLFDFFVNIFVILFYFIFFFCKFTSKNR